MLKRSKKAILTIRSGLSIETLKPKATETVRSCLYEMNRVKEIELIVVPVLILEEIFRDIPKSAPQLHTLCIQSHSPFHGTAFVIHEYFLYDTERLQHVELISCKISWDISVPDWPHSLNSRRLFEGELQRMPALTNLRLKDSTPDDSEDSSDSIYLPCRRSSLPLGT